jgi:hypothetical protein
MDTGARRERQPCVRANRARVTEVRLKLLSSDAGNPNCIGLKDPIVSEIHRYRADYAKRLRYDVDAIGEDIRKCEAKSESQSVGKISKTKARLKQRTRK